MFWFDRENENTVFMDKREFEGTLCDGRSLKVSPDIVADFRQIPFPDESFYLVVFDPPHLVRAGENSWLAQKYGKLNLDSWAKDIKQGFDECMRVLKTNGTLIFKWNEDQIKVPQILALTPNQPLFGHPTGRHGKTHWFTFMKEAT